MVDTPPNPERLLQNRQLAQLVGISVTLNSTLDPAQLLRYIIEKAAELLDCEAASILLYDERRAQLYFTSATGSDTTKLAEIPVPLEGSIAGTVFRQNRPMLINNVAEDPRHFSGVGQKVQFQSRSLLAVPMRIHDKVTGVLEALNKRSGDFNENDMRLLSVIASQAAVAINNARLVQALQQANQELSRADKLKSDFIAIASHELRTPLGVILGYATFLKEDAKGELSEHANMVLTSALHLRALVEDMTNMNLLQVGDATLDLHPLAIQEPIQAACKDIAAAVEIKNQHIRFDLPAGPLLVSGNPDKLELLFANLLNNAVRFTPECGEIHISAQKLGQEVWVTVQDNGIGIPAEELENIFKEFYQVENHLRRKHGGMGLGLAIARGIVHLHNGRIWAESSGENQGAKICVVIPCCAEGDNTSGPVFTGPGF